MSSSSSDSAIFHAPIEGDDDGPLSNKIQPIHIHRPSKLVNWAAIGTCITVFIGFATVIYQRGVLDTKVEAIETEQVHHHKILTKHDKMLGDVRTEQAVHTEILKRIDAKLDRNPR